MDRSLQLNIGRETDLGYIFRPRSVAVVGVSSTNPTRHANQIFFKALLDFGFPGPVYPINPRVSEIMGIRAYASVLDVPSPVDHVICCIPAPGVLRLVEECVAKGVKVVHPYTSGFSEIGGEGKRLEDEILAIARRGGVRMIGPNCIGLYCPTTRLSFGSHLPRESGPISFLSQSGGNARELTEVGSHRGIRFNKVVSYGNAADLNETDFLRYFAADPETKIIAAYIEGVKGGAQFLPALRQAARAKPVIVLKGGRTEAGGRAVASHTGSLAGSNATWDALCYQAGAIQVDNMEEMTDLLVTFSLVSRPRGNRVGVIGIGGGASVQAADDCHRAGLRVPPFPKEVQQQLREFTPEAGTGVRNPIDSAQEVIWNPAQVARTVQIVDDCLEIDLLIMHVPVALGLYWQGRETLVRQMEAVAEASQDLAKPMAVVLRSSGAPEAATLLWELRQICQQAGLPTYSGMGRAAQAMAKLLQYYERRGVAHD